jgi:hypothetical protein
VDSQHQNGRCGLMPDLSGSVASPALRSGVATDVSGRRWHGLGFGPPSGQSVPDRSVDSQPQNRRCALVPDLSTRTARGRRLPKVNIRSIVAPTLSRYPTEYQWQELEVLLRRALSTMPRQTLPEALADEPAKSVLDDWRHRHWLDESAALLP